MTLAEIGLGALACIVLSVAGIAALVAFASEDDESDGPHG
jgi:hypothetical protein